MFTWPRSPYWCDTVAVVVGDSTRPRAILLAMLTMKKETLGFHNFYSYFSSVSPISIGMGFALLPFGTAELRYNNDRCGELMVSALASPDRGVKPWPRHGVVSLGKSLHSHSASLH